jgi:hypothetical protein
MFGKHIYGAKGGHAAEEFNRLKTLYLKHEEFRLKEK